jgi:predicted Zn-dependent protease
LIGGGYDADMVKISRAFALSCLLALLCACRTVPYTGRHQFNMIPAGEETSLGATAYRDTLGKAQLSNDPAQIAMVRRVGERIAKAANKPDYKWEFNVIKDDKTVNAFCLPGGKVAVYTGILPKIGRAHV